MSQELEALVALQTALESNRPDDAAAHFGGIPSGEFRRQAALCQARWRLRRGMTAAALPWLEAAHTAGPHGGAWIAQLWLEAGDGLAALAIAATDVSPAGRLAGLAAAVLACDREAAVRFAAHAGDAWPNHPAVASALRATAGILSGSHGEPDGADPATVDAADPSFPVPPPDHGLAWWLCGFLWEQAGKPSIADSCLHRAVSALPVRLDWQYRLGGALIRHGVVERLPAVWRSLPVRFDGAPRWLMLSCRAWAHTGRANDRALEDARAAQRIDPGFWPALSAQAHLLTGLASSDRIGVNFTAFMDHGPRVRHRNNPNQAEAQPLADAALTVARAAVSLSPSAPLWNDLGAVLFAAGDLPAAAAAFQRALDIDPAQRHAAINFAIVLERTDQWARLDAYLRRTHFAAALPDSLALRLKNAKLPSSAAGHWPDQWRAPPTCHEWRRGTVFSQHWWRALPDLTSL